MGYDNCRIFEVKDKYAVTIVNTRDLSGVMLKQQCAHMFGQAIGLIIADMDTGDLLCQPAFRMMTIDQLIDYLKKDDFSYENYKYIYKVTNANGNELFSRLGNNITVVKNAIKDDYDHEIVDEKKGNDYTTFTTRDLGSGEVYIMTVTKTPTR